VAVDWIREIRRFSAIVVRQYAFLPARGIDMLPTTEPSREIFDVDLARAGQLGESFIAELGKLRELDPVHWSDASKCWLVTRHGDINDGLQGRFPLSNKRLVGIGLGAIPAAERERLFPTMMKYMPKWIIDLDPPEHSRQRKLLLKAFNKRAVEAVRPFVKERVAHLLDKLALQPEIEFNEEIARQLPGSVILKLIGLPQEHLSMLRAWSNGLQTGVGVPFAEAAALKAADRAMEEMNRVLIPEIEARRSHPRDDLLTSLLHAVEDDQSLSLDEMLGSLHVLIVAGHDTTSNTISLGLAALAKNPGVWDYLYRNSDKSLDVCLELMRYIAMATSQPRIASEDFDWHGKHVKRGDVVFLMLAAGNRDARIFAEPERFDPERNNDQSLVFGPGVHHCIGHLLAKMQITEFYEALVQRFAGAQILDDPLTFMPQVAFRGLSSLNVRMKLRF
jgi:cytochrome P450